MQVSLRVEKRYKDEKYEKFKIRTIRVTQRCEG